MRCGVPIWALGAGVNVPREKTRSDWMLGDDRGASGPALVSRESGASGAASGVSEFLGASGASGLACTTNDPARAHRVGQCKPRETLALPIYPELPHTAVETVADAIRHVVGERRG